MLNISVRLTIYGVCFANNPTKVVFTARHRVKLTNECIENFRFSILRGCANTREFFTSKNRDRFSLMKWEEGSVGSVRVAKIFPYSALTRLTGSPKFLFARLDELPPSLWISVYFLALF